MKDRLGRELAVGDEVLFLEHSKTSSDLFDGVVIGFTPMFVKISCPKVFLGETKKISSKIVKKV